MALSSFVKKLLFARQFEIDAGSVNVLGRRKVMLDPDFLDKMKDNGTMYKLSKETLKDNAVYFEKNMGIHGDRLLEFFLHIFETQGYGEIDIVNINKDKKTASFTVKNSPFGKNDKIISGYIAGMLSVLFNSDIDVKNSSSKSGLSRYEVKSKA
jgi:hypothetical protein